MQAFGEFVIIRDLDPWGSGHFTVKPQPSQERNAPEAQSQRAHIPGPAQYTSTQTTAPRASAASVDRVVLLANFLITNTAALLCVSGAGISTSRAWSVSQHKREINRKCLNLQQLIHTQVSGRRGSSVVLPGECRNSWGQPFLRQTPTQNVVRSCS